MQSHKTIRPKQKNKSFFFCCCVFLCAFVASTKLASEPFLYNLPKPEFKSIDVIVGLSKPPYVIEANDTGYEIELIETDGEASGNGAAEEKKESVDSLPNQPVILESVELRTINRPTKIKDQIERVQIAKQDVTIAEQEKEKAKQQAQRAAEVARGEAERNRIEAQGQADKIRIEAEEQAKANELISRSLTRELLNLEQIKTQAEFNKALQVNKDAQIFLTPGGAVPNIWVDAKGKHQRLMSAE